MAKLWIIAQREFTAMVATKAFLFSLVMMPTLMFGGLVLLPALKGLGGQKTRTIVIADASGRFLDPILLAADARNEQINAAIAAETESPTNANPFEAEEIWLFKSAGEPVLDDAKRLELSDQIRAGELYAFVEIPAELAHPNTVDAVRIDFVSQDAALSTARRWLEGFVRQQLHTRRLTELGIDPERVAQARVPVEMNPRLPYKSSTDGGLDGEQTANVLVSLFLPFGIMMLMFMVIFLAAQPMLESGMEEKSNRIAELLLASVSPTQLMAGKLLGNVAGSFVVFAIYGIGGWVVLSQNEWEASLPWSLMPLLIVFQILGVLFYSSIFLAIGAAVKELKEAQSLLLPVWLVLVLPMMVWFVVIRDPNGVVAVTLSFFPPSTPLMMSLRLGSGQSIPGWQAAAAALLMVFATAAVIVLAARIYRASLLKADSAKSIGQLFRRLAAAE